MALILYVVYDALNAAMPRLPKCRLGRKPKCSWHFLTRLTQFWRCPSRTAPPGDPRLALKQHLGMATNSEYSLRPKTQTFLGLIIILLNTMVIDFLEVHSHEPPRT
jgi:hypothetical protein